MTKATLTQARHWLTTLAVPHSNNIDEKTLDLTIRPMAASMIKTYEADAFQDASRESVNATLRFFKEPDIRERLDTWCAINLRGAAALPPEAENAPVSREAKVWLAGFYKAQNDAEAERVMDLIRGHNDEAWLYLIHHDTRAASIAVWRKWMPPAPDDLAADWDDEEKVRAMVRKILAFPRDASRYRETLFLTVFNTFVQVIKAHAPQHGPAMFEEMRWINGGGVDVPVPVTIPETPFNLFGIEP